MIFELLIYRMTLTGNKASLVHFTSVLESLISDSTSPSSEY